MTQRIKYKKGESLGPWGMIYLKEMPPAQKANGKKIRQALFKCGFCGKEFIARIGNVKNGHTKSCGCESKKASIKTIEEYNAKKIPTWNRLEYKTGDLLNKDGVIYIKDAPPGRRSPQGRAIREVIVQCPICHKKFTALLNNITEDKTKSCGAHVSLGEAKVSKILQNINIEFETQKKFPNLNPKKNHPYRFDFYLPKFNCCIEYDGIQHFEASSSPTSWSTEESLKDNQQRDKIKNEYCKDNSIPLLRIPYTDFDELDENYLINKLRSLLGGDMI